MRKSSSVSLVVSSREVSRRRLRLAVYIDREASYGRGLVRGILRYTQSHSDCELLIVPNVHESLVAPVILDWRPDGVIFSATADRAPVVRSLNLPAVSVTSYRDVAPAMSVHADHHLVARQVLDHLFERGLRQFACFRTGDVSNHASLGFAEQFERLAAQRGTFLGTFVFGPRTRKRWTLAAQFVDLAEWLAPLPKPLGLFCTDDDHGWRALHACRQSGIDVPRDVAVISTTNDPQLCEACDPALSSLDMNQEVIGHRAAEMLVRVLRGGPAPTEPVLIPPGPLVVRASSDMLAIADPVVARAIRLMTDKLADGIDVDRLLDHLPVSMSTLARRFKSALGQTPGQVLRRLRLDRVKHLLITTDRPLVEIASDTGYEHIAHLCRDFKLLHELTPTQYRKAHRLRL